MSQPPAPRPQPSVLLHACTQARRLDETRALLGGAAVARVEGRLAAVHQLELEQAYAQVTRTLTLTPTPSNPLTSLLNHY